MTLRITVNMIRGLGTDIHLAYLKGSCQKPSNSLAYFVPTELHWKSEL